VLWFDNTISDRLNGDQAGSARRLDARPVNDTDSMVSLPCCHNLTVSSKS